MVVETNHPYQSLIDDVNKNNVIHQEEFNKIRNDYFSSMLEDYIRQINKDKNVLLIKQKKNISEEEHNYLLSNEFKLNYYTEKLNTYDEYYRAYKKHHIIAEKYIEQINIRIDKYKINEKIRNQFNEDEIKNNPNVKKMINDKPNGYDDNENKYLKSHFTLLNLAKKYFSYNEEDYQNKLKEYLESINKEDEAKIENDIPSSKTKQNNVFESNKDSYLSLRNSLINKNEITLDELESLRVYLSLALSINELEEFTSIENDLLINNSSLDDTAGKDSLINNSIESYYHGLDDIINIFSNNRLINDALKEYFDNNLFNNEPAIFKNDIDKFSRIIGAVNYFYTSNLLKADNGSRNKKDDIIFNKDLINKIEAYLVNNLHLDSSLIKKDIRSCLFTSDKQKELGYELLNVFNGLNTTDSLSDNNMLNKKISSLMIEAIDDKNKHDNIDNFLNKYRSGKKNNTSKMKPNQTYIYHDQSYNNVQERRSTRIGYDKAAIKRAIEGK